MTREEAKQIADFVRSCVHEVITESGIDKNAHTNEVLRKMAEYIENMRVNPSEDAISRADTIEWLKRVTVTDGITFETGFKQILTDIQNMPSVTPKQKMGHWDWVQYDSNPNIGHWHCSECRTIIPHMPEETDNTPIYKWCPMCGAKMTENPTGSNCTACILDGTDACSRGAGRAVDGRACEDFVGESEEEIGPDKKG